MSILTDDTNQIMYVVRVNGANVTVPTHNQLIAEQQKSQLPAETQVIAEVVIVTNTGDELLLG